MNSESGTLFDEEIEDDYDDDGHEEQGGMFDEGDEDENNFSDYEESPQQRVLSEYLKSKLPMGIFIDSFNALCDSNILPDNCSRADIAALWYAIMDTICQAKTISKNTMLSPLSGAIPDIDEYRKLLEMVQDEQVELQQPGDGIVAIGSLVWVQWHYLSKHLSNADKLGELYVNNGFGDEEVFIPSILRFIDGIESVVNYAANAGIEPSNQDILRLLGANTVVLKSIRNKESQTPKEVVNPPTKSEDKIRDEMRTAWESHISSNVSTIMARLKDVYMPGYIGMGVPFGIVALQQGKGMVVRPSLDGTEVKGYTENALTSSLPSAFTSFMMEYVKSGGSFFDECTEDACNKKDYLTYSHISKNPYAVVFYWFHIRMLYGYFEMCEGLRDIAGVQDTNIKKVSNYAPIEEWGVQTLKEIILTFYMEAGLDSKNFSQSYLSTTDSSIMSALLNIAVAYNVVRKEEKDGKKGAIASFELRIGHACPIKNEEECIVGMKKDLTLASGKNGNIENLNTGQENVIAIRIINDLVEMSKGRLFAHEMLQPMIEAGIRPKWDAAILGKTLNGDPLIWRYFMDDTSRVYCIYGGSRSGKGIMTSTIVANALASGLKLVYIDGKPENSVALGKLAWDEGMEAAVFDGRGVPSAQYPAAGKSSLPLETHSKVRRPDISLSSVDKMPDLFSGNKDELEKFIRLTTYLRGVQLMLEVVSGSTVTDKSNWTLFVLDEIQNMAEIERSFRKKLEKRLPKGITYDAQGMPQAKDPSTITPIVQYICNWFKWLDDLSSSLGEALTISMGASNVTVLLIFQTTNWMSNNDDDGNGLFACKSTSLGKLMVRLGASAVKIVGGKSMETNGSKAYGTLSSTESWYSSVGNGVFAITAAKNSADIYEPTSANVGGATKRTLTFFRPFNIFLEPREGSGEDANSPVYLKGYISTLLKGLGSSITAGQILQEGFTYVNSLITTRKNQDLLSFIYNTHDFGGSGQETVSEENDFSSFDDDEESEQNVNSGDNEFDSFDKDDEAPDINDPDDDNDEDYADYEEDDDEEAIDMSEPGAIDNILNQTQSNTNTSQRQRPQPTPQTQPQSFRPTPPITSPNNQSWSGNSIPINFAMGDNNPFKDFTNGGEKELTPSGTMACIHDMAKMLMKLIQQHVGSFDRIRVFEVDSRGGISVNGSGLAFQFSNDDYAMMPQDLALSLQRGNLAELLLFHDIYKFKNLEELIIHDARLAEGRMAREMGAKRGSWDNVTKKFKALKVFIIGDYDMMQGEPEEYVDNRRKRDVGDNIENGMRNQFQRNSLIPPLNFGFITNFWRSEKVPLLAKAAGVVAGAAGIFAVGSFLGLLSLPVGFLFGKAVVDGKKSGDR